MPLLLEKVISGGQTGVDQVGLEVARVLGYETGGTAAHAWKTDEGPAEELLRSYGLVECPFLGYRPRTIANVRAADMTVWFGDPTSPGGNLTIKTAISLLKAGKHLLENPTSGELRAALEEYEIRILNVAGNRRRTNPAAAERARTILSTALAR